MGGGCKGLFRRCSGGGSRALGDSRESHSPDGPLSRKEGGVGKHLTRDPLYFSGR